MNARRVRGLRLGARIGAAVLHQRIDGDQPFQQCLQPIERPAIGSVRQCPIGVRMRFHEEPGYAHCHRRAGEHRHELALAARAVALTARQLYRVRRVEHDRARRLAHDREAAHVGDEIVVAEARAALAHQKIVRRNTRSLGGGARLGDDVDHVARREELPLLDVDRLTRCRHRRDEICLPREEGGRLQHVDDLRGHLHLFLGVDVGQDGEAGLIPHFLQDAQPFLDAGAAKGCARAAIGLVERALVDQQDAEPLGDRAKPRRGIEREGLTLDDAGPGDEENSPIWTNLYPTQTHIALFSTCQAGRLSL